MNSRSDYKGLHDKFFDNFQVKNHLDKNKVVVGLCLWLRAEVCPSSQPTSQPQKTTLDIQGQSHCTVLEAWIYASRWASKRVSVKPLLLVSKAPTVRVPRMATAVPSTTGLLSRGSNHLSSLRLTERWENFRNSFQGHKVLQHFLQGQYHFSRRTCKAFHRTSSHLRCHIESSCNSVQHALSTSLAKTTDILKNAPYLFAKTPDEYSREARDRLDGQWVIVKSPAGPFGQEQQVLSAPHRR